MLSKSVSFRKLVIPFLLAKFACANLAAKFFDVNLSNSSVVYLVWSVVIFISISLNSVLQSVFLPTLLVSVPLMLLTFLTCYIF